MKLCMNEDHDDDDNDAKDDDDVVDNASEFCNEIETSLRFCPKIFTLISEKQKNTTTKSFSIVLDVF